MIEKTYRVSNDNIGKKKRIRRIGRAGDYNYKKWWSGKSHWGLVIFQQRPDREEGAKPYSKLYR